MVGIAKHHTFYNFFLFELQIWNFIRLQPGGKYLLLAVLIWVK